MALAQTADFAFVGGLKYCLYAIIQLLSVLSILI